MRFRRKPLGRDFARRWPRRVGSLEGEQQGARVLIEEPDGAEAFAYWSLLMDNGYEVEWCPGPGRPSEGPCPLVASGHCELVEHADVVVSSLGVHYEPCRDVLGAIRRLHPETPVIVETTRGEFTRWGDLFDGSWELRAPVTRQALLGSVHDVLADRQ